MNELEFEEKWEELDYKILMVSKKSGMISTVPDWGLERLLNLGIKFEEYEICSEIKKEIDKRNESLHSKK